MQTVDIVNGLPKVDFGEVPSDDSATKMYPERDSGELSMVAEP